jgi:hypothetical protein
LGGKTGKVFFLQEKYRKRYYDTKGRSKERWENSYLVTNDKINTVHGRNNICRLYFHIESRTQKLEKEKH